MQRIGLSTCAALSLGAVVAGCQSAPARYADNGMHATYATAASTGGELYHGAGRAVRAPLHDLNMMQDKIAPVLLRAENRPYDLTGVNSCGDVLDRVSELDLALGPDVDTPKERKKRSRRSADFAANAALDAAGSAAEHFIPMRSTIKQLTGATRYENHVRHATLAGDTRRSFLKAVGMTHNCSWPAAPLDFHPAQVAAVDARWSPVQAPATLLLASAAPLPAQASAAAPGASPRVVLVSAASATRPGAPVFVPVSDRLVLPRAEPAMVAGQAWRPAARAGVVQVSAPLTTQAALSSRRSSAALGASGSSAAASPWDAATGTSARP